MIAKDVRDVGTSKIVTKIVSNHQPNQLHSQITQCFLLNKIFTELVNLHFTAKLHSVNDSSNVIIPYEV